MGPALKAKEKEGQCVLPLQLDDYTRALRSVASPTCQKAGELLGLGNAETGLCRIVS